MEALAPLLLSWWTLGLIFVLLFSFGTGPMCVFYMLWRLHRNVGRIANALEHLAYNRPAESGLPAPQRVADLRAEPQRPSEVPPREPGVSNSAFGR